jgi:hypothetical protein
LKYLQITASLAITTGPVPSRALLTVFNKDSELATERGRILAKLKRIKKIPGVIVTDGLAADESLLNGANHVLCRFHHQPGGTL